ncbi:MAG: flagellar basal body P-ring protein FlgI [Alphaproteobacteria bacterium]|nr:flagellar basal body P-ring protein FlgI [Alphaproteobacteria bacterium]
MLRRFLLTFLFVALACPALAASRIKDIVNVQGVRENTLVGYGLVVGLRGTGDSVTSIAFTEQSLIAMLERLGINTRDGNIMSKNVAAVMVTASLPPFARAGSKIDVMVGALGDSTSLSGGTLIATTLMGADSEVYAIAQGPIIIGGFEARGQNQSVTRAVPTSGRIASGGIIEREIPFVMNDVSSLNLSLRNPDLTTAKRVTAAINSYLGTTAAKTMDHGTVQVTTPYGFAGGIVGLLAQVENLIVRPDVAAKVVIDEKSGVVVIGEKVRISTVAIAQGNLTIRITETPMVSQPAPFSQTGETVVVTDTSVEVDTGAENQLHTLAQGVSIHELVSGLNALGVGPRDIISILQAIKASGALQAEIEVI